MQIKNKLALQQYVYLKTDPDQHRRMIIGIKVCATLELMYEVQCGTVCTWHYECELSEQREVF